MFAQNIGSVIEASSELTVTTDKDYSYAVVAYNGGHVQLTDVEIETTGSHGRGISVGQVSPTQTPGSVPVPNVGSSVVMVDTDVTVGGEGTSTGNMTFGVYASGAGSTVNTTRGRIAATGDNYTRGIHAAKGAEVTTTDTAISTAGVNSHVVHAYVSEVDAEAGLTDDQIPVITLNGGTVTAGGDKSWGLYAQNGGQIISTAKVTTAGAGGFGAFAENQYGAGETKITLNGGSILTTGSVNEWGHGGHGVIAKHAGGIVEVNNTAITIEGDHFEYVGEDESTRLNRTQAAALLAEVGGLITTSGATITTTGDWAFGALADGVNVDGVRSKIIIDPNTTITTTKIGSSTVFARDGGQIEVTGATLKTAGQDARGLYARGSDAKVTATNVTVNTTGLYGHGAYARQGGDVSVTNSLITTSGVEASGLYSRDGSKLTADGVTVATKGNGAHGAYVRNGSEAIITGTNISTAGAGASALHTRSDSATTSGGKATATNSHFKTTGTNAHGVVLLGGSSLNMTGGSITATGAGSAGMRVHNQSTATLNGVTVVAAGSSLISSFSNPDRTQTINIGSGSDLTQNDGTLLLVSRETTDGVDGGANGTVALNLQSGSFSAGNVLDAAGSRQVTVTKASDAYWAGIVIDKTTVVVPDGGSQDYTDEEIDGSVASGEGSTITFNNGANITGSVSSGADSTTTFSGNTNIGGDVAGQQGSSASFSGATSIGGSVAGAPGSSFAFSGSSTDIGGSVAGVAGAAFSFSGPTNIGGNVVGDGASFNFGQGTPTTIAGNVGLSNGSILKGGTTSVPIQIAGDAQVGSGSTLGGNLNIAGMVSGSGTLGPGNSIGVQTYGSIGEFTGTYAAEVNAAGQSDLIRIASGDADLRGIDLVVGQENGTGGYKLNHDYTIVETAKADGISAVEGNKFASESLDASFNGVPVKLDAAKFGDNTVKIVLSPDTAAIDELRKGWTSNQNATWDGLLSAASGNALSGAVLSSPDMQDALNQLSGELHGSTQTALLNNSQLVTRTLSNRMRANLGAGLQAGAPTAQASGAVAGSMPTSNAYPLWAQVVGSWTELDDDGNAAKAKSDTAGLFIGADTEVGKGWRVGAALGFTDGDVKVNDRNSKSDVTSYTAALYGGNSWKTAKGQVNFLAGAAYTTNEVDSRRTVTVGGSQTLKADYDVNTTQLFTELGYAIPVGQASVVEPYLGLAWMSQKAKSFDEEGGSAALHGDSQTDDVTTFTLGLRGATTITTGKSEARLMAGLGWRHAAGDVDASRSMSFIQGAGDAFRVAGAPIAKNAAVVDLGAEMNVGKNTALGLSYNGQFGNGVSDNAGSVYLRVRF
ncbi:autotransporter outer membrane beta-barrel domain-containing protein [Pollutimonas harenae]|uniref:Autotransporter domain-containing protein n=1 Tax=Pollutimonas harenae TaxID=657015 RepID=A0A853H321_9BURK|nr:autotransporter outer membrane beta-barrel domain-containing protein [Pollutimonas harenae]NYT86652.1 autotransporter domain-containing protein [Pollutimonas harenae]